MAMMDQLDRQKKSYEKVNNLLSEFTPLYCLEIPPDKQTIIDPRRAIEEKSVIKEFLNPRESAVYEYQLNLIKRILEGEDTCLVSAITGEDFDLIHKGIDYITGLQGQSGLYIFPNAHLAKQAYHQIVSKSANYRQKVKILEDTKEYIASNYVIENGDILIATPQMVHWLIVSNYAKWKNFLERLDVIFLDSIHYYSEVAGSHLCSLLRRLLRVAESYKCIPQIIATVFPVDNPRDFFSKLTARAPSILAGPQSTYFPRYLYTCGWNPSKQPMKSEKHEVLANLAEKLLKDEVNVLVVCKNEFQSNKTCDFLRQKVDTARDAHGFDSVVTISHNPDLVYKNTYNNLERLLYVVSEDFIVENASKLESAVDVVIYFGCPNPYKPFYMVPQKSSSIPVIQIFLCENDSRDHFLLYNPNFLLDSKNGLMNINPSNEYILKEHLKSAAQEYPISPSELAVFGVKAIDYAEKLDESKEFVFSGGKFYNSSEKFDLSEFYLDSVLQDRVDLFHNNQVLQTVSYWDNMLNFYPGAMIHLGKQKYEIMALDLNEYSIDLHKSEEKYHTIPKYNCSMSTPVILETDTCLECTISYVESDFDCGLSGYYTVSDESKEILNYFELGLPRSYFKTQAIQLNIPDLTVFYPYIDCSRSAIHCLDHALRISAPFFVQTKNKNIGTLWFRGISAEKMYSIILFDNIPGGMGYSKFLYQHRYEWFRGAYRLLSTCTCMNGCKKCAYLECCPHMNQDINKAGAMSILNYLLS